MSTEMILLESRLAVDTVLRNEIGVFAGFGALVIGLVLYGMYVNERWTWIPRQKHNRVYRERF